MSRYGPATTIAVNRGSAGALTASAKIPAGLASALRGRLYRPDATAMLATAAAIITATTLTVADTSTLKAGMSVTVSSGGVVGTAASQAATWITAITSATTFTIADAVVGTAVSIGDVFTFNGSQGTGVTFALSGGTLAWDASNNVIEAPATPIKVLPATLSQEPVVGPSGSLIMVWPQTTGNTEVTSSWDNCFPTAYINCPTLTTSVAGFYGFIEWMPIFEAPPQ